MTTIARQQKLDSVTLLAGNLAAWVPLAISITPVTQATDPLRSALLYLGFGVPVILVLTLFAERSLLNRPRLRSKASLNGRSSRPRVPVSRFLERWCLRLSDRRTIRHGQSSGQPLGQPYAGSPASLSGSLDECSTCP